MVLRCQQPESGGHPWLGAAATMDNFSPFHNPWLYSTKMLCSRKFLRCPTGIKWQLLPGLASPMMPTWTGSLGSKFTSPSPFLLHTGAARCLQASCPFSGSPATGPRHMEDLGALSLSLFLSLFHFTPYRSRTVQEALDLSLETQVQVLVLPFPAESLGLASPCSHGLICDSAVGVLTYWPCVVHHRAHGPVLLWVTPLEFCNRGPETTPAKLSTGCFYHVA